MSTTNRELDGERLLAAARETTGLTDFGDPSWREGFDVLVAALADEDELNEMGVALARHELVGFLATRLRLVRWRSQHPELADEKVTAPVFILGLPRSGTTMLHSLLAQDPSNRVPLTWEVARPCPPPATATYDSDERIAEVQHDYDQISELTSRFSSFHAVGARSVGECIGITASDFRSRLYTCLFQVPSYAHWLEHEADMSSAYRWHRRFLEHLQSRHSGRRWVLKAPAHSRNVETLLEEYPDAVLVVTHRDPLRSIGSMTEFAIHMRRMCVDRLSRQMIATETADYMLDTSECLRASRTRDLMSDDRVIDVHFSDFVADPLAVVRRIYGRLHGDLEPDIEQRMRSFLLAHPAPTPKGRYSFADTGLDAGALRERAREYQDYFGVQSEPLH